MAARLFERAAAFAGGPDRAGADLVAAAQMWFAAGDAPRAAAVVERVWASGPDGALRAEAAHLLGFLTMLSSRADDGLHAARARGPPRAVPGPQEGRPHALRRRPHAGDGRAAARRAALHAGGPLVRPALDEPQLIGSLASALTLEGRAREARPLFAQVERYLDDVEPLSPEGQTVVLCLTPRTWLGEFEAGERHLERWVGRARDAGCLAYIGFPQAFGAELDFRRGRWRDALARVRRGGPVARGDRPVRARWPSPS